MTTAVRVGWMLLVVILNIGCDQVSKTIARTELAYGETVPLYANHLTLTLVENPGAFLSLGTDWPPVLKNLLLIILPILVLAMAALYVLREPHTSWRMMLAVCFLVGGGIGNLFDRVFRGSVTDFLHLRFGFLETGIFNMADVSVMVGVSIWIIELLRRKPKEALT